MQTNNRIWKRTATKLTKQVSKLIFSNKPRNAQSHAKHYRPESRMVVFRKFLLNQVSKSWYKQIKYIYKYIYRKITAILPHRATTENQASHRPTGSKGFQHSQSPPLKVLKHLIDSPRIRRHRGSLHVVTKKNGTRNLTKRAKRSNPKNEATLALSLPSGNQPISLSPREIQKGARWRRTKRVTLSFLSRLAITTPPYLATGANSLSPASANPTPPRPRRD